MTEQRRPYTPDTVSAPGEVIAELIEERGITQRELADRMGRSEKNINQIINGKAPITPEAATQLELVLGTPASYWLTHEGRYQAHLASQNMQENFSKWHDWLDVLPVRKLMEVGAIPKARVQRNNKDSLVKQMLEFYGVASPVEWQAVCVVSAGEKVRWRIQQNQSDPAATATWLRLGELAFQDAAPSRRYDAAALRALLPKLRELTVAEPSEYLPELVTACAGVGLVLAYVPAIPRARASGAARWLGMTPLIQLSLYGRTNDRFWFTFFHETRHILAHERGHIFMDEWDGETESDDERDADDFARDFLIPRQYCPAMNVYRSETQIVHLAREIGVHPGIVVGRMQHDGNLPQKNLNRLKQTIPVGTEHVH